MGSLLGGPHAGKAGSLSSAFPLLPLLLSGPSPCLPLPPPAAHRAVLQPPAQAAAHLSVQASPCGPTPRPGFPAGGSRRLLRSLQILLPPPLLLIIITSTLTKAYLERRAAREALLSSDFMCSPSLQQVG